MTIVREVLKGVPDDDGMELHYGYHHVYPIIGAPGTIVKETAHEGMFARTRIIRLLAGGGESVIVDWAEHV